jgi:hypothetical protein
MASDKTGGGRSSTACSTVCLLNRLPKCLGNPFQLHQQQQQQLELKTEET